MDDNSKTPSKSEVAHQRAKLLMERRRLEAQLELNQTRYKLDELKRKVESQEAQLRLELAIENIGQNLNVLNAQSPDHSSTSSQSCISPVMLRRFAAQEDEADPVPVPRLKPVPKPRSCRQAGSVSPPASTKCDVAEVVEVEPLSKNVDSQAADVSALTEVMKKFTLSLNDVIGLPRRSMPSFRGDPLQFFQFTQIFDDTVSKHVSDPRTQLMALIDCCVGEPREIIQACAAIISPSEGLQKAKSLLWNRYGQRHVLVHANLCKLSGCILKGDGRELQDLANAMLCCGVSLRAWGYESSLNSQDLITTVLKRLPRHMQVEFHQTCQHRFRKNQDVTFEDLTLFVQEKASMASDFIGQAINQVHGPGRPERGQPKPKPRARQVYSAKAEAAQVEKGKSSRPSPHIMCPLCGSNHPLFKCRLFLEKAVAERWATVKSANVKVCFNCLGLHHAAKDCKSHRRCNICNGTHHSLLHAERENTNACPKPNSSDSDVVGSGNEHTCTSTHRMFSKIRLKVLPVTVWNDSKTNHVSTYAFLDEGSNTTLCSEKLLQKLNITDTERHSCTLHTVNGANALHHVMRTNLSVFGCDSSELIQLKNVLAVPNLPGLQESIPSAKDSQHYPYLSDIKFVELDCWDIDLLIGADVQAAHHVYEARYGQEGQPTAILTGLGWTLSGPDSYLDTTPARQVNWTRRQVEFDVHEQFDRLYNCEFRDLTYLEKTSPSVEDLKALDQMRQSVKRVQGRYEVGLPWRSGSVDLPYNRKVAESRLSGLRKRLMKNESLFEQYKLKIDEYLTSGHARKIPENELSATPKTWYIPHHPTEGKFRIVFDCACRHGNTSLNDKLFSGPDLFSSLLGVLLRFRQFPIAIVADIRGMFHQVRVEPEDRDSLRFLWWPNHDLSAQPEDYQMMVHLFGATSSPSCCSFALGRCAEDNLTHASSETLLTVKENFYVDDLLKSVKNSSDALKLISELTELLESGGFHLTKFLSNEREVLRGVPESDHAVAVKKLSLDHNLPTQKTLGVHWDAESDRFVVVVNVIEKPATRRGLLSVASQLYDPIGFLQPFILPAKILLQRSSKIDLAWDDEIPPDLLVTWESWISNLHLLANISLPRCFLCCMDFEALELHSFSDASISGYGAVCYIRYKVNGCWVCAFVIGKARVAPTKTVTVPRLELAAAVTAVKLSVAVCQELKYKFDRVRFWTDSTSVIQYIANETKRFKTYVANRLAVIREHSKLSQWRYVNTDANPADLFSRGVMPASYKKSETWLKGPDFLLEDDVKWPASPVLLQPLDNDPEVKQDVRSHATSTVYNCFDVLFARFSVFYKMLSVVAWMLRFMSNLSKRLCGKESDQINTVPRLCNAEIESATLAVVKVVQRSSFPELYNNLCASVNASSLKSNRVVSKQFGKLHPFMDDGIIRVGGRLQRSNLPFDCRHQILLPSNHLVTDLIVNHYHCLAGHSGTLHVLSNIRTKFWIVKGHATVKRVLRNCRKCRLWKAKVGEQLMSPLPVCRVTPSACVFQHVGLDYFGPITIKQGRNNLKRYACVFSCMSTRALHIEIAFALDTSSFMNVFRRFCGRRGFPSDIYSDNGSNFIGAEREMREAVRRLNCDVVHAAFLRKGVNWHFNPPAASHQGGIWERMIRTIRKVLRMLTGDRILSEDQLATFMVEVERIVNDRPLTPVSSDTGDLNTLSPSALLLGRLDALLAPDEFIKADGYRRSWRSTQYLVNQFWQRWLAEYMPLLQQRQKWLKPARNLCVGDVVLVVDRPSPRGCWPKAIVEEVFPDRDNLVRRARVRTAETTLLRDIRKLCLLEAVE